MGKGNDEEGVLSPQSRTTLLDIARKTLAGYVKTGKAPRLDQDDPELQGLNGAFVSLHKGGQLRGCIGNFRSSDPLYRTISEMTISAAARDPRFAPVNEDELDEIDVEISVLSPLRRIEDIEEIEVGKHGIYITKGLHRGVLLPQVAERYGWDRITFLEQTCLKAGLSPDDWKKAKIQIFSAEIFGDEDLGDEE